MISPRSLSLQTRTKCFNLCWSDFKTQVLSATSSGLCKMRKRERSVRDIKATSYRTSWVIISHQKVFTSRTISDQEEQSDRI